MTDHGEHARYAYIGMASVAGAITALSLMNWKRMSWPEIGLTVFVGTAFSVFAVPYLAADLAGINIDSLRVVCGITYLGATGANIFIPMAIRRAKALFGLEDAA